LNVKKDIWQTPPESIHSLIIDSKTDRALDPLPKCKHCQGIARPNVLMFGDFYFLDSRHEIQESNYDLWISSVIGKKIAIIEIGAGKAVPTVRK